MVYTITPRESGYLCIDLSLPKRNNFKVSLNGEKLYSETYSLPQLLAVGYVEPGDTVTVELSCSANENSNITVSSALLNDEVYRAAFDVLSASTLELTEFENTYVAGTIDCNRDGLLYTSIPQNGNWTATVDGQPAEIVLVGDAMIALNLTEGTHDVEFTYHNAAFALGWKITLGCALLFGAIALLVYKPKRYQGKYVKSDSEQG